MLKVVLMVSLIVFVNNFVKSKEFIERFQTGKLLIFERLWVDKADKIIQGKKGTLEFLIRQFEKFTKTVPSTKDRTLYLENLSNSFALVRRVAKDWRGFRSLILTSFKGTFIKTPNIPMDMTKFWYSAVKALVRIQEVYNISTDKLANSDMDGVFPYSHLTADDCADVALFYYKKKRMNRAVQWFEAALSKSTTDHSIDRKQVLEYLSVAYCFNGDANNSASTLMTLLQEYPSFNPSKDLYNDYQYMMNTTCKILGQKTADRIKRDRIYNREVVALNGLCLKENYKPPKDSQLRCRHIDYKQPHLKISPYKMEELVLDPPVLLFYDVIHDGYINKIQTVFHSKLKQTMNYNANDETNEDTQFNAWIFNQSENDGLGWKLAKKVEKLANLGLERADKLMIGSYGLGGEIKLHMDTGFNKDILNPSHTKADYATIMFWLNDVAEGGYTVFPFLNLAVKPIKGAAALWFNRYPDWQQMFLAHHSGCPVVRGTKWILTQWFHVFGQDYPLCTTGKEKSYKYYYL